MADIAREAEIARATLYLHFSDKDALFEALTTSLIDEALAAARAAWVPEAPLSKNIAATLLAKELPFFYILYGTPYGGEVLELHAQRTASHIARLDAEFSALLSERGRESVKAGADLTAFNGVKGFVRFLATAGAGLKHEARSEKAFVSAIELLAGVAAHAAGRT